jgi:hypothetical protein
VADSGAVWQQEARCGVLQRKEASLAAEGARPERQTENGLGERDWRTVQPPWLICGIRMERLMRGHTISGSDLFRRCVFRVFATRSRE